VKSSNSEMQAFKRCRRKWWFRYYLGLGVKREGPVGPRAIGTRVHACVAQYYNGQASVAPAFAILEPLALHDMLVAEDVERCPDQEVDIRKEADLSRAMLEGYFEWLEETGADEGLEIIAAEQALESDVGIIRGDGSVQVVTIMGKLDLRVRQDGVSAFLDHKTVQEFTTPTRTLHLDEQMLLYHWLVEQTGGERVGGAIYNMIRKVKRTARSKPPFYERFTVQHAPAEVQSFYVRMTGTLRVMIGVRAELDEGSDPRLVVYPTPTRNCSWDCDFYPVCPLIDRPDIGAGQTLIDQLYEVTDPYARYGTDVLESDA
jgi:hypothetical protein